MSTIQVIITPDQYTSLKAMLDSRPELNATTKSVIFDVLKGVENKMDNRKNIDSVGFYRVSSYISPEQIAYFRSEAGHSDFAFDKETADFLTQFTEHRVKSATGGNIKVTMSPQQYDSLKKMLAERKVISLTVRSILFDALKGMEKKMAGRDRDIIGFCQFPCYISPDQIAYLRSEEGCANFVFDEETEGFLTQFTKYVPKLYS